MTRRSVLIANRHPRLRVDRRAVARMIEVLDENASAFRPTHSLFPVGELSLVFLTDAALARLHADFLDDSSATDVITFNGDSLLGTAGEICVSADAALRHVASFPRARTARQQSNAFSAELTLYLVHGWLHLAGYDDLVPAKKRAMRRAEARAMNLLRRENRMPLFALSIPPS